MNINIEILANGNTLTIKDNTQYISEGFEFTSYTKDQCQSVILIESHETKLTDEDIPNLLIGTIGDQIDLPKDGHVTVHYIILPNKEWINHFSDTIDNINHKSYYYIHKNEIYKYGEKDPISFKNLLDICCSPNIETNLITDCTEHVNIWNLYNCYINLCKQLLESRNFSNCNKKNTIDSELIYKRDLVWMVINVIKYLSELHNDKNPKLVKIQQYIEMFHSCTGICPESSDTNNINNYGCGCSKR